MTLNSSDQLFESLSAMVDDEASELEVHRILRSLDQQPEVLDRWHRYHLIGAVMRREYSPSTTNSEGLAASLADSIANSATAETKAELKDLVDAQVAEGKKENALHGKSKFKDLLGKSAIAASFAATLVIGFQFLGGSINQEYNAQLVVQNNSDKSSTVAGAVQVVTHAPLGFELPLPEARTVGMAAGSFQASSEVRTPASVYADDITDVKTQELLNRLLIQHAERASTHGSLGIMPFARVHSMGLDAQPR